MGVRKISSSDSLNLLLENIDINDDTWRCSVIMLVEAQINLAKIIKEINKVFKNGSRKSIIVISREKLFESQTQDK